MAASRKPAATRAVAVVDAELKSRVERMRVDSLMRANKVDPQQPQLDFWPDDVRALPNDYAKSALFTIRNKRQAREALQEAVIFHYDKSVTVTFTGIELRADDDELVWLQIVHYAKTVPLGQAITFNLHQLVRDIGWAVNGRNYERARACLIRLKANSVRVDSPRTGRGVAVSLIERFAYDDKAYTVHIDRNLILMFMGDSFAHIEWAPYRALSPTARKLYDYAASHRSPYPLALQTFHKLASSLGRLNQSFRREVREACAELQASGLVKKCWLHEDDRIYFER